MSDPLVPRAGLAAHVRLLRRRAGLSQEALAEKAGIGVTTVAAIEAGRRRPNPHTLRVLADALELTPAPHLGPPVPPTRLIGREREIAAARARLLPSSRTSARLLTLVGPGGVGKTRLAVEILATVHGDYADGAAFVDLAPIRDSGLVPPTIARVLGPRDSGGRSPWELLGLHLRSRQMLVVLDNFEHLTSAAPLLSELLAMCPAVTLLVTSRTALRLRAEHRQTIGPLATPVEAALPPLEQLANYSAVHLFVERVRQVTPEFCLDDRNAAAVVEICHRLDGTPLALELAAARMQLLSVSGLLQRLDRRLNLLSGGAIDLPERQRTLRNMLAWSYDLLDPLDRALFRRLAVFAGGWTLEAVAAVCADTDLPAADVLYRLGVLIDSSLVRRMDAESAEPRFGMHETVREYALERLHDAGEEAHLRDRHLAYWVGVGEAAEAKLEGPDQRLWLDRLERDHDNLRAALHWSAQDPGSAPRGLRLATVLLFFWFLHGHLREGRDRVEAALEAAEGTAGPWLRGRGLAALGHLLFAHGQFAEARTRLEAALAIMRPLHDDVGAAFVLRYLGVLAAAQGDHASAPRFLEESLATARRVGAAMDVAMALAYLGDIALRGDDVERARGLFEEYALILRQLRNQMVLAYPLRRLGLLAYLRGDIPLAIELCVESVGRNQDGGERLSVAAGLVTLAPIADSQGEPELAVQLLSKAESLASSIGGQMLPFEAEQFEAAVAHTRERLPPEAWRHAWANGRPLLLDVPIHRMEQLAHRVAPPRDHARSM